jgi:hypothetical protein
LGLPNSSDPQGYGKKKQDSSGEKRKKSLVRVGQGADSHPVSFEANQEPDQTQTDDADPFKHAYNLPLLSPFFPGSRGLSGILLIPL